MDRKTVMEFELLARYHEVQSLIDRTTDAEVVQYLEERKKGDQRAVGRSPLISR